MLRTVLHTEANPILGLNVVIDDERRLGFASFGHIATSHARAVDFVRSYAEVGVAGPRFDTVVTSSAGYPLDKTYYQTVKGMCLALGVLAPGGDLIIASENSEGLVSTHQHSRPLRRLLFPKPQKEAAAAVGQGSDEFRASQKNLAEIGSEKFLEHVLAKSHADIDEWETEMLLRAERASAGNIHMWSPGLSAVSAQHSRCWIPGWVSED